MMMVFGCCMSVCVCVYGGKIIQFAVTHRFDSRAREILKLHLKYKSVDSYFVTQKNT